MKTILIGLAFVAAVSAMLALTLKSVTWILDAVEWIGVWTQDWREEYRKWKQ